MTIYKIRRKRDRKYWSGKSVWSKNGGFTYYSQVSVEAIISILDAKDDYEIVSFTCTEQPVPETRLRVRVTRDKESFSYYPIQVWRMNCKPVLGNIMWSGFDDWHPFIVSMSIEVAEQIFTSLPAPGESGFAYLDGEMIEGDSDV